MEPGNARELHRFSRHRGGFSLVEVLAVLVLLALLAGVVTISVRSAMASGKRNVAITEVGTLRDAVEQYHVTKGRYPRSDEGFAALVEADIIEAAPTDPWQTPYQYNAPGPDGRPFEIISFGADGRPGGTDDDADIVSWRLRETDH